MELNMKNNGQKARLVVITALVSFSVVFILTGVLMTHVYGAETLISKETYNETLDITQNATNQTQGHMINSYVENVKQDICPTLNNQTQIEECWKL